MSRPHFQCISTFGFSTTALTPSATRYPLLAAFISPQWFRSWIKSANIPSDLWSLPICGTTIGSSDVVHDFGVSPDSKVTRFTDTQKIQLVKRTSPLEGIVQLTDDTNSQPGTLASGEQKQMYLRIVRTGGIREVSQRTNSYHDPYNTT